MSFISPIRNMTKNLPLVIVLGATACGKSKLALEIAKKFDGEIVSADSMQVYKGLDIVTNKVTQEEQQQARHHMIDLVNPLSRFSVIDFRDKAIKIIQDIQSSGKLPIVVGGTHYYIESLIWKSFTMDDSNKFEGNESDDHESMIDKEMKLIKLDPSKVHTEEDLESVEKFFQKPILGFAIKHLPAQKLWDILEEVDPESAHCFHPNDLRRVIRMLQIIQQKKRKYSEFVSSINKSGQDVDAHRLGGPLRFPEICVFWVNSDEETLNRILDERVDLMIERGLLTELEEFHNQYNKDRIANSQLPNYEQGIFQTIGFKEFHDYLLLSPEEKTSERGQLILKRSIDDMKISTRRYARKQLRWIRRRFLRPGTRELPPMYKLNVGFDEDSWLSHVQRPAFQILGSMINDKPLTDDLKSFQAQLEEQELGTFEAGKHYCEICDRTIIGKLNIDKHLQSNVHDRRLRNLTRKKHKTQRRHLDDLPAEVENQNQNKLVV